MVSTLCTVVVNDRSRTSAESVMYFGSLSSLRDASTAQREKLIRIGCEIAAMRTLLVALP
jgi:hypothetical protein